MALTFGDIEAAAKRIRDQVSESPCPLSIPLSEATSTNRKVDQEMLDASVGILEDEQKVAVAG